MPKVLGRATLSFVDTMRSIGDPITSIGDPMRSIGDTKAAIGDTKTVIGEPMKPIGDPMRRVGGTTAGIAGRWGGCEGMAGALMTLARRLIAPGTAARGSGPLRATLLTIAAGTPAIFIAPATAQSVEVVFVPTQDTTLTRHTGVVPAGANGVAGALTTLYSFGPNGVSAPFASTPLFNFNLTPYEGCTATSCDFFLRQDYTEARDGRGVTITLRQMLTPWSEATSTWNNTQPISGNTLRLVNSNAPCQLTVTRNNDGRVYGFPINVSDVNPWFASPGTFRGLTIANNASDPALSVYWSSREGSYTPRMHVFLNPPSPPGAFIDTSYGPQYAPGSQIREDEPLAWGGFANIAGSYPSLYWGFRSMNATLRIRNASGTLVGSFPFTESYSLPYPRSVPISWQVPQWWSPGQYTLQVEMNNPVGMVGNTTFNGRHSAAATTAPVAFTVTPAPIGLNEAGVAPSLAGDGTAVLYADFTTWSGRSVIRTWTAPSSPGTTLAQTTDTLASAPSASVVGPFLEISATDGYTTRGGAASVPGDCSARWGFSLGLGPVFVRPALATFDPRIGKLVVPTEESLLAFDGAAFAFDQSGFSVFAPYWLECCAFDYAAGQLLGIQFDDMGVLGLYTLTGSSNGVRVAQFGAGGGNPRMASDPVRQRVFISSGNICYIWQNGAISSVVQVPSWAGYGPTQLVFDPVRDAMLLVATDSSSGSTTVFQGDDPDGDWEYWDLLGTVSNGADTCVGAAFDTVAGRPRFLLRSSLTGFTSLMELTPGNQIVVAANENTPPLLRLLNGMAFDPVKQRMVYWIGDYSTISSNFLAYAAMAKVAADPISFSSQPTVTQTCFLSSPGCVELSGARTTGGGIVSLQWFKDGQPLSDGQPGGPSGSRTATLKLDPPVPGTYTLVASGPCGTATSNPVQIVSGACCSGTACNIALSSACTSALGVYRGDATVCFPSGPSASVCCRADFNSNGQLNIDDLFIFLNAWFASDPRCDFSAIPNGVNIDDIFIFLNLWFQGC